MTRTKAPPFLDLVRTGGENSLIAPSKLGNDEFAGFHR